MKLPLSAADENTKKTLLYRVSQHVYDGSFIPPESGNFISDQNLFNYQACLLYTSVASGAELLYYPCFLDTVPLLVGAARNAGFTGVIMGGDGWDRCV